MPPAAIIKVPVPHSEHGKERLSGPCQRGNPPLRGQEHAVTCGESKQEPPKAALLPTAEISVPLTGKSAGGGPCPSPPFLCRHSSPRSPFSPAKCCLCSLGSRSRWWAGYSFPDLVSPPLLYLLCLLVHLDLSWLSRETRRAFQSRLWGNFLALRGTAVRAMKDHQQLKRSYRLSPMVVSWQLSQHNSVLLLEGGHLPPCFLLPKHTYPLLFPLICSQMRGPALSLAPAPALVSPFGKDTCY